MITSLHILGWGILWLSGILIFPTFIAVCFALITNNFYGDWDEDTLKIIFILSIILYFILSAIWLITR